MRGLLFAFLGVIQSINKSWRKIRGISEQDIHDERIVSGKAWEEFCDNLKKAGGAILYPGTPRDPFQQAEGVRYLTRLTRASLEAFVEYYDPAFPRMRRMVHETVKMGADNPDNYYMNAQISGDFEYLIKGNRNTIHYLGFFTQNGNYGTTGGLSPCGVLEHFDMHFEEDGSFEIVLSKEKKGENWLKIEDETSLLMVRQTYMDRANEEHADMEIFNLDGRTTPDPVSTRVLDEGLKTAGLFVGGASMFFSKWVNSFKKNTNKLPLFDPETSNAAGGDANIIYYHSHWKLNEDEALVIRVKPPECDSWNFQLNNYWMESLDYRYFNICVSKGNAKYQDDGSVEVVVSHKVKDNDPNWLYTAGHNEGTMCWRWYRSEQGADSQQPQCEVVSVDSLM